MEEASTIPPEEELQPTTMRKENEEGNIRVIFGHDETAGYYISVYDLRLEINKETGDDFDEIRYEVSADGTGVYLEAHTGGMGFGKRVSVGTMRRLWALYGATQDDLGAFERSCLCSH